MNRRTRIVIALVALGLVALGACSRAGGDTEQALMRDQGPAAELRLGFFPNLTHGPALIGLEKNLFTRELGSTALTPIEFKAGGDAIAALFGGSVDATFIGPGPAINGFVKSDGQKVRLVAGVATGGAQLVVKPDITTEADLIGTTIVTPQKGNTQDIALKKWLTEKELTDKVTVQNTENALTLEQFRKGSVQGAWLPEPWASRLVLDSGAKVFVDEKDLWPDGKFPTTVLIVRTDYLKQHPQTIQALVRGLSASIDLANHHPTEAKAAINAQLKALSGQALSQPVLDRAFDNIGFELDPHAALFPQLAKDAVTAGIFDSAPNLTSFIDLTALNAVLTTAGKPTIDAAGLDKQD